MSELRQVEVERLSLRALYDLANQGGSWVGAAYVAGIIQQDVTEPRARMALRTLEDARLVRGRHNAMKPSEYEITEAGYKQVEEMLAAKASGAGADETDDAPASDRVVGFDHNSRDYRAVRAQVSELQNQLLTANDLGDLTPRSAKVAASEVEALGHTLDLDFFRPSELWVRAKMTLRWIGQQAASAVVGAAALALLTLFAALLGFPVP